MRPRGHPRLHFFCPSPCWPPDAVCIACVERPRGPRNWYLRLAGGARPSCKLWVGRCLQRSMSVLLRSVDMPGIRKHPV